MVTEPTLALPGGPTSNTCGEQRAPEYGCPAPEVVTRVVAGARDSSSQGLELEREGQQPETIPGVRARAAGGLGPGLRCAHARDKITSV